MDENIITKNVDNVISGLTVCTMISTYYSNKVGNIGNVATNGNFDVIWI